MAKMTGARAFAEMMKGYGVDHIFFVPAILSKALAEMEDMPIRRVMVHGEKSAAYMADGYARASGKVGVCMAQCIGASNLAAGLRDAYMAGSPVVAITGGPTADSRYRHTYQEVEDFSQFAAVTKFSANVGSIARIPDMVRQAFREATSGAPGPAHLQIAARGGHIAEQEGDLDPFVEPQFARAPAFRPEPEMDRIRAAAALLLNAKKPVIVAGGGVVRSGAESEVVELSEKLQIPVATALHAKATIVDRHPLAVGVPGSYSRSCANSVLLEADLVFFIGSHAGGQVTHNWHFPPPATAVIRLDINPSELGRNYPNKVSILGDARTSLRRLIDTLETKSPEGARAWVTRVQQLVAKWREDEEPNRSSDAVPMRPERVCREISEALPSDGVLVSDTGHAGIWTGTMIEFKHPTQRYFRCAGSLGWGFPAALGVKCALPDKPVLCFTGDGGFYYHLTELETARRHNIGLVVLVNNNSSLNQEITLNKVAYDNAPRGRWTDMWTFTDNNFAKIAESFGVTGIRVEQPGELKDALKRAFAMGKPVVIDAVTDRNVLAKRVTH
ncbi:MAG: thiamine pyrophosphate-binding protein [Burkholderiales bacterium]